MCNSENVLKVANAIRNCQFDEIIHIGFNMAFWHLVKDPDQIVDKSGKGCGTTCCIGGWTHMVRSREQGTPIDFADLMDNVDAETDWLDLTNEQAHELFWYKAGNPKESPTNIQAAICLELLAATNVVDWKLAIFKDESNAPEIRTR